MRQNIPRKFTIEIPLPFSNLNRRRIEQLSETCNRKDIRRIKIKKWCREDIPYMKMIHEIQIEEELKGWKKLKRRRKSRIGRDTPSLRFFLEERRRGRGRSSGPTLGRTTLGSKPHTFRPMLADFSRLFQTRLDTLRLPRERVKSFDFGAGVAAVKNRRASLSRRTHIQSILHCRRSVSSNDTLLSRISRRNITVDPPRHV